MAFVDAVRAIKNEKTRIAYIRFETEPAFQAQVEWGDFQIEEPGGTIHTVYAFAMVLGYARAMYVEFVEKRTLEAFMDCHIHAFDTVVEDFFRDATEIVAVFVDLR